MYRKSLVPLSLEVSLNREPPPWGGRPFNKVLVPLDRSERAEDVMPMVRELLSPDGEGILLHVIPKSKPRGVDRGSSPALQETEARRAKAMGYLKCARDYLVDALGKWRCEVVAADSVAQGIADFAISEQVDLVAMCGQNRKGMVRVFKQNIAQKVQQKGALEVRVLRPRELVAR